jgi:transposase
MTYEELQALCQQQQATIDLLSKQVQELTETVRVLKELLNRNSKNSSSPPSVNRGSKNREDKDKSNKLRKKRAINMGLQRFPNEQVNRFHDHRPVNCSQCGSTDFTNGFIKSRHQTVDLPPIKPIVEEHRRWSCRCKACGRDNLGQFPKDLSRKTYGPNIRTWIVVLATKGNVTIRKAMAILQELLCTKATLGTSVNIANHFADAVDATYKGLMDGVKTADLCYVDETGWYKRSKKRWVWQCATSNAVGFMISASRGAKAARELLGDKQDRILVTDRWEPYDAVPGQRQYCFAHLIRNLRAVEERGKKDKILGGLLRASLQNLCHERGLWKAGQLSWEAFLEKAHTMKAAFHEILCIGRKSASYRKTKRLCDRLLKEFDRMWVFIKDQRVELTNNESERNLRSIVLKRKVSLGSWGASGEEFIAKAYSIMATLAKRGFSFAHYVGGVFGSVMLGLEVPPLPG